jgi:hypothetical protein
MMKILPFAAVTAAPNIIIRQIMRKAVNNTKRHLRAADRELKARRRRKLFQQFLVQYDNGLTNHDKFVDWRQSLVA